MAHLSLLAPILLFACIHLASSAPMEQHQLQKPLNREQIRMQAEAMVEKINKGGQTKWTAKLNPRFAELTSGELRNWLGLAKDPAEHQKHKAERAQRKLAGGLLEEGENMNKKKRKRTTTTTTTTTEEPTTSTTAEPTELESFDAREEWLECADMIGKIQDQSGCGSCWAVSSASVMSDRLCIGGGLKVDLSAEDILTCETSSYGCQGGYPEKAFQFYYEQGVCTGSNYTHSEGCKPYPFPPNFTHFYSTPRCKKRCENRKYKERTYSEDKYFGFEPVHLEDVEAEDIMDAIWEGGPVEANFIVYDDFFAYSSGVYEVSDGAVQIGGHAVRIIGWGLDEESGMPYWLAANSWGPDWGMDGYFKIARGQDECGIESWGINFNYNYVERRYPPDDEQAGKRRDRRRPVAADNSTELL